MYATTGKAGRMARKGRTLGVVVGESSTSLYDYSLYPCSTYRLYHVNCQSIDWLVHTITRAKTHACANCSSFLDRKQLVSAASGVGKVDLKLTSEKTITLGNLLHLHSLKKAMSNVEMALNWFSVQ